MSLPRSANRIRRFGEYLMNGVSLKCDSRELDTNFKRIWRRCSDNQQYSYQKKGDDG